MSGERRVEKSGSIMLIKGDFKINFAYFYAEIFLFRDLNKRKF